MMTSNPCSSRTPPAESVRPALNMMRDLGVGVEDAAIATGVPVGLIREAISRLRQEGWLHARLGLPQIQPSDRGGPGA